MVLPIRRHLGGIKRMLVGDFYIGRGCRQRGLGRSEYCNDFKVAVYGRETAIDRFGDKLASDRVRRSRLGDCRGCGWYATASLRSLAMATPSSGSLALRTPKHSTGTNWTERFHRHRY